MNNIFRLESFIQSIVLLLLMLAIVNLLAAASGYSFALGLQAASPNNQTGISSVPSENQSIAATNSDIIENRSSITVTRGDLDPVLNNLFTARENLLRNNLISTLDSLNDAGRELFELNITKFNNVSSDLSLTTLQKQIEYARMAVLNSNSSSAIRYLNTADSEFIIVAQELR